MKHRDFMAVHEIYPANSTGNRQSRSFFKEMSIFSCVEAFPGSRAFLQNASKLWTWAPTGTPQDLLPVAPPISGTLRAASAVITLLVKTMKATPRAPRWVKEYMRWYSSLHCEWLRDAPASSGEWPVREPVWAQDLWHTVESVPVRSRKRMG